MAFLRVRSELSPEEKKWHLFNDQQIEIFADFKSIAEFITNSNCVPTVVIYEKQTLPQMPSKQDMANL